MLLLGFFFVGEGVGYVGGIVSVVVDGMYVGLVIVKIFNLFLLDFGWSF